MITLKLNGKTIVIADGCNVEIDGDEIRVEPGEPSVPPQPIYVPLTVPSSTPYWVYPYQPYIHPNSYPAPWNPPPWTTITCDQGTSSASSVFVGNATQ